MFWQLLVLLILLIPLLAIVLDSRVGEALAARLERPGAAGDDPLRKRLEHLESEVDRLSEEVRRLDEESRFLHELLAERPPPDERALEAGENDD